VVLIAANLRYLPKKTASFASGVEKVSTRKMEGESLEG